MPAYNQWKATFVKGSKVIRPENQNDTVSEGIAYGMLIAVNMNDQTLFDSLYGYWKANSDRRHADDLVSWQRRWQHGTACAASGGSATDADEDAAYALLMADKALGRKLQRAAITMIGDIWSHDIDGTRHQAPQGRQQLRQPKPSADHQRLVLRSGLLPRLRCGGQRP